MSAESPESVASGASSSKPIRLTRLRWWCFVVLIVIFLIAGQTAAVLLGRFYFKQGGKSIFMATLVQSSGFPILFIPLLLFPFPSSPNNNPSASPIPPPPKTRVYATYIALGFLTAADNWLYSVGLLYLPASTCYLISTTQLVFTLIFSFFLNSKRLTPLIINAVGVVTFSAILLAVNQGPDSIAGGSKRVSKVSYALGFVCTLVASALYSLLLSLMQFCFQRVLRKKTFYVVVEMQIWMSVVGTVLSVAGLFISGQWRNVNGEMERFRSGENSYVMTLVWTAACWQFCSIGIVGLIFLVSGLFSNVVSTAALAVAPVASVVAFRDKMNGVKIIAVLQAFWGLGSYAYQEYLDERRRGESMEPRMNLEDDSGFEA